MARRPVTPRRLARKRSSRGSTAERLRRATALIHAVGSALDLEGVLDRVTAVIPTLRPRLSCAVYLIDADRRGYRLAARVGDATRDLPVALAPGEDEPPGVGARPGPRLSGNTPIVASLEVGSERLGVLHVLFPAGARPTPEEHETIRLLAAQAAGAIRNARLLAETDARRRMAEALADVGRLVSETLDPAAVAGRIADSLLRLFGAQVAVVFDVDPTSGDFVRLALAGDPGTLRDVIVFPKDAGFVGLAARERRTMASLNVLEDPRVTYPRALRPEVEGATHRALLAVPLMVQQRVIGVLAVGDRAGRVFTEEDVRLAEAFASHAAIAVANARLHETALQRLQRERAARELSEHLLSDHERIAQELAQSEQRYRAIVEGSIQAMLIHVDGLIRFVNTALFELLGHDRPEDMIGRNVLDFVAPHDRPRLLSIREARRRGKSPPTRYELQALRRDGSLVSIECIVTSITWDGGPATLVTLIDTSERRALEEQLQQSQKMEAIGRLAGGVAHDFNNLLTVIGVRTRFLLDDLPPAFPGRGDVELIEKTSERATVLTRQLLAFARRQTLQPTVLDLGGLITSLGPMLRGLIGEDVSIGVVCPPEPARVLADAGQIEQVVVNLAVNARDAMPRGGRLTLELQNVDLGEEYARRHVGVIAGPHVLLAVADTGIGMDQATLARVFEPFFTTKPPGKGTGLGLSTVYGIVRQSGGHVWVYSEVGVGTTFKLYFPRVERDPDPPAAAPTATATDGTETILLVEDHDDVRKTSREALERHGYTVLEARDGTVALQIGEEQARPIHLLVTDVIMPGLNGRETAERFAARHPETRVLYISGYTDDAIVHHGVLDPGVEFIQKPFGPNALARKVREVLDASSPERA